MLKINKRGQGLPMNVIVIAIIVLVVLVILIAFFAGGFSSIVGKIRDLFGGTVQGQVIDNTIQTCETFCDSAKATAVNSKRNTAFCTRSFLVDQDGNADTPPRIMKCGSTSRGRAPTIQEQERGIEDGGDLGVTCPGVSCGAA